MQAGGYAGQMQTAPGTTATYSGIPNWASQYCAQDPMYASFFAAGDFSRSGYLDEAGLQAALTAAGETSLDSETIEMMILMFDTDNNRRIDYNEFSALMGYLNSMKNNYAATAAANGGVVGTRDASMLLNNTHGAFVNNIGGADYVERGLLPTVNPSQQGFYSIGNFIKIAIIIGLLRTLYEHNKLPFINNSSYNAGGQAASYSSTQTQYGGQYGQQGQYNQYGQPNYYGSSAPPAKSQGLLGRIFSSFKR